MGLAGAGEFEEEGGDEGAGEGAEGGVEDVAPVGGAIGKCQLYGFQKCGQNSDACSANKRESNGVSFSASGEKCGQTRLGGDVCEGSV